MATPIPERKDLIERLQAELKSLYWKGLGGIRHRPDDPMATAILFYALRALRRPSNYAATRFIEQFAAGAFLEGAHLLAQQVVAKLLLDAAEAANDATQNTNQKNAAIAKSLGLHGVGGRKSWEDHVPALLHLDRLMRKEDNFAKALRDTAAVFPDFTDLEERTVNGWYGQFKQELEWLVNNPISECEWLPS